MDADTTFPTVAIGSDAIVPVTGSFAIAVTFSEPVAGFALGDVVVGNGGAARLGGSGASYAATITPAASGLVTVDMAAGAAENSAGNSSMAADRFMFTADLPAANRPPMPGGTLPDQQLAPDDAVSVDVSEAFVDPDGDALTHTASSSPPQVVTATMTGEVVTVTAVGEGAAIVRVMATDPGGLTATQSFTVTVAMRAPFTDDPPVSGVTPIKAVHFMELRARIDAQRRVGGAPGLRLDRLGADGGSDPGQARSSP